ncbi:ASPH [Symbiodinium natans]|uniref:ASPH protein n=1 Tax=Symbiodinium natans TaxID=878477 RepID=A0A812V656_9DINO|nr:ASPH [Symbiodinium natans]
MDQPRRLSFCALAGAWTPPELSTDEFRNQELLQQSLFEEYYHVGESLAQVTPKLRELAEIGLTTMPAIAFGVANGLYHFCFYREEWASTTSMPGSMLNIEDMLLAERLFQVSVGFSHCLDSAQDLQRFLMGMCQQKLAMLFLIQNELGASLAEGRELQQSARVLRAAHDVFQSMKRVPYHAALGAIGWLFPSDVALNDELYPRTFGPVWPSSSFPYAEFLESNFEVFLEDLKGILAQEGLFEQLRRAARNAEGLAVWPPDTRGHVQLLDGRDESLMLPTCAFAQRSCALLASRPELAQCPRAAAFLARLEPGAWLKPHLGNSRRLAAHLGLVTPPGAVLNVGSVRNLQWAAGRALVWDDTHVHDARHAGEGTRYILQSFFCHPCEQRDLYRGHTQAEVQSLGSDASCDFTHPVRAEVSRALRQEMDERERAYRAMPRMTVPANAPVSV